MAITGFISDDHNTDFLSKYRIVSNHINSLSNGQHAVVHGGDFSAKDEAFAGVQQGMIEPEEVIDLRIPTYEKINNELDQFDAPLFGVLGNNDCTGVREALTNMTFLDTEDQVYEINGRKFYGVYHSTGNIFNQDEEKRKSLRARDDTLTDRLEEADILVTHEGITPESCASKNKNSYDHKLNEVARKRAESRSLINLCGHAHGQKVTEEDGITTVRAFTQKKRGACYFILHEGTKDTIYEVSVKKIYEEAERLAPEEVSRDTSKPFLITGPDGHNVVAFEETPENIDTCLGIPLPSQRLQTTNGKKVIAFNKDEWNAMNQRYAALQQNQEAPAEESQPEQPQGSSEEVPLAA